MKRLFDILLVVVALPLWLPLLGIVALALVVIAVCFIVYLGAD